MRTLLDRKPRAAASNLLQAAVEREHRNRRQDPNTLHETVMKVWDAVASEEAFQNVFKKLPIIYSNIKNNLGGNDTVESNRGKAGAARIAAQEAANINGEGDQGGPLLVVDVFEDDDMEGEDADGVEDDEGVINLL